MSDPSLSEQYQQYCKAKQIEYFQEHPKQRWLFELSQNMERIGKIVEMLRWTSQ